jgi:hypothetical protein
MTVNKEDGDAGSANKQGVALISAAAKLMLRCAGFIADRQAETDGWKLFYAVDVDVVKLYLAPADNSGYATVFGEAESADTRDLLARLMGDFLFREFRTAKSATGTQSCQLFIVPPHDEELNGIIVALSDKVINAVDHVDRNMDVVLADLVGRVKGDQLTAVAKWVVDAAPMLVEVFDGRSGPRAELARFEALGESRLVNLERYQESSPAWAFPLPLLETSPEEFEEFTEVFSAWKERLIKHKSVRHTAKGIVNDAYALATIEILNARMAGEHRKLMLVTGTWAILRATAHYMVPQSGQPLASFADLYIREPQSFMADASFFGSGSGGEPREHPGSGFDLLNWLNLFFPKAAQAGTEWSAPLLDRLQLQGLAENAGTSGLDASNLTTSESAGGENNSVPASILKEWRTQVHTASVSRNIDSSEDSGIQRALDLIRWLREQVDQEVTLKQLRTDLSRRAVRSLSSLYSSTSWLGLWSRTGSIPDRIRGIPALRFDGDAELAREYCDKVVDTMRASNSGRGDRTAVNVDVAEMYMKLSQVDDSHYHSHVIHALAYATKGNWSATRTLCRIALLTADGLPDWDKRDRKGREAAYLLAVAERRLAIKVSDLDMAKHYLEEAASRDNVGARPDNRFLSEAIAIDVATLNFEVFIGRDRARLAGEAERLIPAAVELLYRVKEDPLKAREWVRQQVLTNVLNVVLLACDAKLQLSHTTVTHVRYLVSAADEELLKGESVAHNRDSVATFIYVVAAIVFAAQRARQRIFLEQLNEMAFPVYLPFDKGREIMFRQLASSAVPPEGARE